MTFPNSLCTFRKSKIFGGVFTVFWGDLEGAGWFSPPRTQATFRSPALLGLSQFSITILVLFTCSLYELWERSKSNHIEAHRHFSLERILSHGGHQSRSMGGLWTSWEQRILSQGLWHMPILHNRPDSCHLATLLWSHTTCCRGLA